MVSKKPKVAKELKLDLACGSNKREGFTGVDFCKLPGVDIVHDLNKYPWPFKAESVDEVHISHYVEHVDDLMKFMDEVYRITKKGAKITIVAPYYTSSRCWQDPTHKRAISEYTFLYFNKGWRDNNKLSHYPIKSDFDFSYGYGLVPEWGSRYEEARLFAIKHYMNVVNDIHVNLVRR